MKEKNEMSNKEYIYHPIGIDFFDPKVPIEDGRVVVKVQPYGCPKNGTLGHCYIGDPDTKEMIGLVLEKSLTELTECNDEG
tara:strand:+ start:3589 stop:3831 length:243 start_codon:yes stop_codon:yes gene_type:complete